jgi:hypothetical protein
MMRLSRTLLFASVLWSAFGGVGCAPPGQHSSVKAMLPMPGFAEGWRSDSGVRLYTRETLFEHINGEAELYFPYGFVVAAATRYERTGDSDDSITADVYEMGSLLDAFGVYSNYRTPDKAAPPFGSDGFYDDHQLMFYQDKYFVRLTARGSWEQSTEALLACGSAIAERLPQPAVQPPELELLKIDGVDPRTTVYLGESVLGYAFFEKGLVADAMLDDHRVRAFVVLTGDDADAAMRTYTDHLRENEATPRWVQTSSGACMLVEDPLHKGTVVHERGTFILGVTGLGDPMQGLPLIERMIGQLEEVRHGTAY